MQPTVFTIPGLGLPIKGYGLMLMVGFLSGIYLATRRAAKVKADPDLILNMGFLALIFGVLGARAMFVLHHWEDSFAGKPNILIAVLDVTAGGLEYYGGLLGAMGSIALYMLRKGVSVRMYFDIIAPAAMWGLAITRLGCFLNGCCWGGQCEQPWAVRFPYGSPAHRQQWLDRDVALPAELLINYRNGRWGPLSAEIIDNAAALDPQGTRPPPTSQPGRRPTRQDQILALINTPRTWYGRTPAELRDLAHQDAHRAQPVHPAQLYGFINAMLLSLLLAVLLRWRRRHGVVFGVMIVLYPISRTVLELVRVDNPFDTGGLTISQSISVGMLAAAGLYWVWLLRQPLRSPKAVPFVPPPEPAPRKK